MTLAFIPKSSPVTALFTQCLPLATFRVHRLRRYVTSQYSQYTYSLDYRCKSLGPAGSVYYFLGRSDCYGHYAPTRPGSKFWPGRFFLWNPKGHIVSYCVILGSYWAQEERPQCIIMYWIPGFVQCLKDTGWARCRAHRNWRWYSIGSGLAFRFLCVCRWNLARIRFLNVIFWLHLRSLREFIILDDATCDLHAN